MFWTADVYILIHLSCKNQRSPLYTCIDNSLRIKSLHENGVLQTRLQLLAQFSYTKLLAPFSYAKLLVQFSKFNSLRCFLQTWCYFHLSHNIFRKQDCDAVVPTYFDSCVESKYQTSASRQKNIFPFLEE